MSYFPEASCPSCSFIFRRDKFKVSPQVNTAYLQKGKRKWRLERKLKRSRKRKRERKLRRRRRQENRRRNMKKTKDENHK